MVKIAGNEPPSSSTMMVLEPPNWPESLLLHGAGPLVVA